MIRLIHIGLIVKPLRQVSPSANISALNKTK
jgi:hypothetical protein